QFRVQVQALARFNRHFFLAFAWHKVAPWSPVYASHTKDRIGSWRDILLHQSPIVRSGFIFLQSLRVPQPATGES
ncbi:hypothetical protein, partial [Burkholderia cepacia]|uniref:hypothetical protein n=1 Tax=Burkholderia cepacia TaxID=292 RepID=UPI001CF3FDB8